MCVRMYIRRVGSFMVSETEMDDPDVFFIPDTAAHNVSKIIRTLK